MTQFLGRHKPFLVLILVSSAAHLVLMSVPPLSGDEAFYWEWSRNLDLGYYTHPPMTAWVIALVTMLLGTSVVSLRMTALLLHLGTLWLVYRMAHDATASRKIGFSAALIYAIMPVSVLLGTIITTDCALIFFWTAASYLTKKAVVDGHSRAWWGAGIGLGGALLTKFFSFLFPPGVFIFILLQARYRRHLLTWRPYAAFVLALLLFGPFLYWNAANNWATFQFNLVARNQNEGFALYKPLIYAAGQAIAASPVFLICLLMALWRYVPGGFQLPTSNRVTTAQIRTGDSLKFYGYVAAVPLLIFLAQSLIVEVGAHWTAVAYPLGSILLAAWFHRAGRYPYRDGIVRKRWFWMGAAGAAAIAAPIVVLMLFPRVLPDEVLYIDPRHPKQNMINNYFGWREAGRRIDALRREYADIPGGLFLTTKDYSIGSMLDFYTPAYAEFALIGYGKKDFHGREFLYWRNASKIIGANTLYVSDVAPPARKPHKIAPYFESVEQLEPLIVRDANDRILRIFHFTIGRNYRGGEPDLLP